MCGRRPAGGRGLARCERMFGLYPTPACQSAAPSVSPRRNSTLRGRKKEAYQEGKEGVKRGRGGEGGNAKEAGGRRG